MSILINKHTLLAAGMVMISTLGYAVDVDPLAAKTMVVYASNSPDSVSVKDYYTSARSIPATCPITLPNINATEMTQADYNTYVRNPIRGCLNAVGSNNILYIVLAYIRPYRVLGVNSKPYAIDSYLSDIWDQYSVLNFSPIPTATHRYYAGNQSQGNFYLPFQSLQTYRSTPRASLLYSVWRLDGQTPAIAKGLVDKAASARNTLTGAVCLDRNSETSISAVSDFSNGQGDWEISRAGTFLGQAGFTLIEDQNTAEFGTSPAPAKCPADGTSVAFYTGWYSLDHYNGAGVFNFAPGAIGIHLDSNAALDPRGGSNWAANALIDGITVTAGAMTEPYLEGIPRPDGIARNLLEGANVGDAFLRNTRWLKWMILNIGDPLYRPFPASGLAPFNPAGPQDSLYLPVRELVGGGSTTGIVNLAAVAPPGGLEVALVSGYPSASVPATITVPAGARSAVFPITTSVVSGTQAPVIIASFGATTLRNALVLDPLLSFVALSSNAVTAGFPVTGAVFLNASAPAGGAVITLASSDTSAATVPPTVTVPAGLGRVTFPIATLAGGAGKTAKIQANYLGALAEATLRVN